MIKQLSGGLNYQCLYATLEIRYCAGMTSGEGGDKPKRKITLSSKNMR